MAGSDKPFLIPTMNTKGHIEIMKLSIACLSFLLLLSSAACITSGDLAPVPQEKEVPSSPSPDAGAPSSPAPKAGTDTPVLSCDGLVNGCPTGFSCQTPCGETFAVCLLSSQYDNGCAVGSSCSASCSSGTFACHAQG